MPLQAASPAVSLTNTAPLWPTGATACYSQAARKTEMFKKRNIPNSLCPATVTVCRLYKTPSVAALEKRQHNEMLVVWTTVARTDWKTAASSSRMEISTSSVFCFPALWCVWSWQPTSGVRSSGQTSQPSSLQFRHDAGGLTFFSLRTQLSYCCVWFQLANVFEHLAFITVFFF